MSEEVFRPYYDDPMHPENYHLKIYTDDEEMNQNFLNLQKKHEVDMIYYQRIFKYDKYIQERIEWIKNQTKDELSKENELRKNIRVLIILGSAIEKQEIMGRTYIKHNEYIVTTLLIAHLFQYACGVPIEQIMITSSNPSNFPSSKNIISSPSFPSEYDGNAPCIDPNDRYGGLYSNRTEFRFFNTVFAQVGTDQYNFLPSDVFLNNIYPFNRYFLKKFKTDENSQLFVFFIDCGMNRYFQNKDFGFYIERLMEIKSKHMFVINQSCNSGSLIDLIHISDTILDLFKNKNIAQSPNDIFNMLIKASHPLENNKNQNTVPNTKVQKDDSDDSSSYEEIDESSLHIHIDNPDQPETQELKAERLEKENLSKEQEKIQKECEKERIINEIVNIFATECDERKDIEQQIRSLVDHMSVYDPKLSIDPKLFHQFEEKAFILCSCLFGLKSPTLPFRDFYIGNNETVSSHGGVFSSLIIECLFHPQKSDTDIMNFISHVQSLHNRMKVQFYDILRDQFTYSDSSDHFKQLSNEIIKAKKSIDENTIKTDCDQYLKDLDSYFSIDYLRDDTFLCPPGVEIPDMKTILLPEKYWNVDISKVDTHEYSHLKIYDFNYFDEAETISPEGYGPVKGLHNLLKLVNDFFNCLENEIRHFIPTFEINSKMKHRFDYITYGESTIDEFQNIKGDISYLFVPNTVRAFQKLEYIIKYQLEYDFRKAHRLYRYCCVKTLKKLLPLYRPIEFTP